MASASFMGSAMELKCVNLDSGATKQVTELGSSSTVAALKACLVPLDHSQARIEVVLYKQQPSAAEAPAALADLLSLRRARISSGDSLYYKLVPAAEHKMAVGETQKRSRKNGQEQGEEKYRRGQGKEEQEEEEGYQVDLCYDWQEQDTEALEKEWGNFEIPGMKQQQKGHVQQAIPEHITHEEIAMTPPPPTLQRQRSYVVMGNLEISQLQKDMLDEVILKLDVDASRGVIFLRAFDWDVGKLVKAWGEDKEAVLKLCKIQDSEGNGAEQKHVDESQEILCEICFTECPVKETYALNCGHRYCLTCWKNCAAASFDKGQQCVFTECPWGTTKTKCHELVPHSLMTELLEGEKKQKFEHWLRLAFVKQNEFIKWCPRPGCDKAVEYKKKGMKRVQCACGFTFCFGCGMEDHEPAPCNAMREWMAKNSAESGIFKWLKSNAKNEDVKTCTKCHIVIQKNQGCKHMTCTNCRHEFCWLCFQPWNGHDNTYCTEYTKEGKKDVEEKEKLEGDEGGSTFRRYQFYHSRWENYKQAVEFGIRTKESAESRMEALQNMKGSGNAATVKFLVDAIDVVIDCRKLLEWSYVWCYYLEDKDSMMALFRNHLNNLEDITEDLGMLVEQPLEKLILDSSRTAVINKSRVLTKYRRNIVDFAREHDEHVKAEADTS